MAADFFGTTLTVLSIILKFQMLIDANSFDPNGVMVISGISFTTLKCNTRAYLLAQS